MKKNVLYALWGGLFCVCGALGFLPEPEGLAGGFLTAAALAFFVPPAMLLMQAKKEKDAHTLQLVRNLSALSLGLTALCLILNFATAFASEALGNLVHAVLVIVSSPMICSGHWALSLFLWACLLMGSLKRQR